MGSDSLSSGDPSKGDKGHRITEIVSDAKKAREQFQYVAWLRGRVSDGAAFLVSTTKSQLLTAN